MLNVQVLEPHWTGVSSLAPCHTVLHLPNPKDRNRHEVELDLFFFGEGNLGKLLQNPIL